MFVRGLGSILTRGKILLQFFCIHVEEPLDANIGIIANFVYYEKTCVAMGKNGYQGNMWWCLHCDGNGNEKI